jgi:hypothetical protein
MVADIGEFLAILGDRDSRHARVCHQDDAVHRGRAARRGHAAIVAHRPAAQLGASCPARRDHRPQRRQFPQVKLTRNIGRARRLTTLR